MSAISFRLENDIESFKRLERQYQSKSITEKIEYWDRYKGAIEKETSVFELVKEALLELQKIAGEEEPKASFKKEKTLCCLSSMTIPEEAVVTHRAFYRVIAPDVVHLPVKTEDSASYLGLAAACSTNFSGIEHYLLCAQYCCEQEQAKIELTRIKRFIQLIENVSASISCKFGFLRDKFFQLCKVQGIILTIEHPQFEQTIIALLKIIINASDESKGLEEVQKLVDALKQ